MQNYIRGLKFEEKPNYEFLRHTIHKCMKNNNYEFDYKYDWQTKKQAANKLGTTHRKT
jgi:predicted transcriptional regulator